MNWHQIWEIASAPDNVPIVALLVPRAILCLVCISAGA